MVLRLLPALKVAIMVLVLTKAGNEKSKLLGSGAFLLPPPMQSLRSTKVSAIKLYLKPPIGEPTST